MTTTRLWTAMILGAAIASGCGGNLTDGDPGAGAAIKPTPTLTITPNPVQAGSIAATRPVVTGTGFGAGKTYDLQLLGFGALLQNVSTFITADKTGSFTWAFTEDLDPTSGYGIPDAALSAGSYSFTATLEQKNGTRVTVASTTLQVSADPGSATMSPSPAVAGTPLALSGSGAQPGQSLTATWYDATGCTCWLFGCYACTWTPSRITLTADASGAFTGTFTPSPSNNGYCAHTVSIADEASGAIVATSSFDICP